MDVNYTTNIQCYNYVYEDIIQTLTCGSVAAVVN